MEAEQLNDLLGCFGESGDQQGLGLQEECLVMHDFMTLTLHSC